MIFLNNTERHRRQSTAILPYYPLIYRAIALLLSQDKHKEKRIISNAWKGCTS